MLFRDRPQAGRELGRRLARLYDRNVVVVGLPRGGVVVAAQVARALSAPLDVVVVRKLGVPVQPELAMGAISEGGFRVVNDDTLRMAGVSPADLAAVEARERVELDRRIRRFRGSRPRVPLAGRTVIVVDDGIATGATASAACQAVRAAGAARVVLAAPVGPPERIAWLHRDADEVICLATPDEFFAIGSFYDDFTQTPDEQVTDLLCRNTLAGAPETGRVTETGRITETGHVTETGRARAGEVSIPADLADLVGDLTIPDEPRGLVVFAHGSGSSRHSPRNRYVADVLVRAGLATLLFDLLTPGEELDRRCVFDISTLARRLVQTTRWLREEPGVAHLPVGYFGASTGAAAALCAAAEVGPPVTAVVSRGGRPDLAEARLPQVTAPTLLIVGERDGLVLDLNQRAQAHLRCENKLAVVPEATHLFTEPDALETVAALARDWFVHHLALAAHRS